MKRKTPLFISGFLILLMTPTRSAQAAPLEINFPDGTDSLTSSVDIFIMVALLSLLPPLLIMLTSYVKIIVVLALTRNAIGTATTPPNIVISGIAIVLTLFVMSPIINEIKAEAYDPYKEGEIEITEAIDIAKSPLQKFMVDNSDEKVIEMYLNISGFEGELNTKEDVPVLVSMASSVTTQLTQALGMGALIMLSFLVIDMIVGTVLMFLGMIMLPPQMISLPIKIITFLAAGGFTFIIEVLLEGIVI